MANYPVTISSTGVNTMLAEVTTLTSCSLNALYFPNDVQKCEIQLAFLPIGVRWGRDIALWVKIIRCRRIQCLYDRPLSYELGG